MSVKPSLVYSEIIISLFGNHHELIHIEIYLNRIIKFKFIQI